ncbi:MAG: CotS family spore coat protein [Caulobacteraceae bacterium]
MQPDLICKYSSDINQKEAAMLDSILKHYDFNILSVEKVRSAYKVYTDNGVFCLKRVGHGYRKAKKCFYIIKHLRDKGFNNVAEYYQTREKKIFLKLDDAAFYITYWIEGREASFRIIDDILRCAELLASFHNHAKGFEAPKHVTIKSDYKKWKKHFEKYLKQMEAFKSSIDKLKLKSEFDYMYRNCADYYCNEARLAIKLLKQSKYADLSEYQKNELYVCHDSFYYQNIIISDSKELYLVDLESCLYDIPMSDLGKFIRRVMTKGKYKWDFDLCRKIIESYSKIRPVSKEEYAILLTMLIFPHKFWKLGRKRYVKNKKWNEEKFKKKLKKIIKYREYKKEFIKCFMSFYNPGFEFSPDELEVSIKH